MRDGRAGENGERAWVGQPAKASARERWGRRRRDIPGTARRTASGRTDGVRTEWDFPHSHGRRQKANESDELRGRNDLAGRERTVRGGVRTTRPYH